MVKTLLIQDDRFLQHTTGIEHPEQASRIEAIRTALAAKRILERCQIEPARAAEREELLYCHTGAYVDRVEAAVYAKKPYLDTPDCPISPGSFKAALASVGGVLKAVDLVMTGSAKNAFCETRPPGHHAERDFAMGFCFFNNVAIAARHLQKKHKIERVCILDWDVHHGNGTQHMFETDPDIFFCSLHGHPDTLYPGTGYANEEGRGAAEGTNLNIPLLPGTADTQYLDSFRTFFIPAVRKFKPQFILVSAGFDGHLRDPLGTLHLTTGCFATLTDEVLALASELCEGRLVSSLEGGYDLRALGEAVTVHVDRLTRA